MQLHSLFVVGVNLHLPLYYKRNNNHFTNNKLPFSLTISIITKK
ncbi:hypothetical protein KIS1582_2236 [Cytobacillus firmus]|uniref:Uncharacterized protein n=1 Tax=Cytobacillus firmus TaxID=1399 RepID=A0A800MX32_CYTFI|nr:hypothetical protein KIS1582_2236 [Cytobacillus firmus]